MENISKIVISSQGKILGYIFALSLDGLKKKGYYVADEETEIEYFLKNEDILLISKEYVLIENEQNLQFVSNTENSLLGRRVLNEKLENLGVVSGLHFNKYICDKILTEKSEIPTKYVKNLGENIIFVDFGKRRKNFKRERFPKINLENAEISVKIQNLMPEKVNLSTSYYVGRVCLQDIIGQNNERIVSKGDVVTKNMVEKAKQHNRLNQLFFALKR